MNQLVEMMNGLEISDSEPMCVVAQECKRSATTVDQLENCVFVREESDEFEPQKKKQRVKVSYFQFQGIFIPSMVVTLQSKPKPPKPNEFDKLRADYAAYLKSELEKTAAVMFP